MNQAVAVRSFWRSSLYSRARWLVCILPPAAVIAVEETPGLSGLDGINAAALIFLSPVILVVGFGLTAGIAVFTRWAGRKIGMRSPLELALLMLAIVGVLSPWAYLDRDWLLLVVIEAASLPAALVLTSAQRSSRDTGQVENP